MALFKRQRIDKREVLNGEELNCQMSEHGLLKKIMRSGDKSLRGVSEAHVSPPSWF